MSKIVRRFIVSDDQPSEFTFMASDRGTWIAFHLRQGDGAVLSAFTDLPMADIDPKLHAGIVSNQVMIATPSAVGSALRNNKPLPKGRPLSAALQRDPRGTRASRSRMLGLVFAR